MNNGTLSTSRIRHFEKELYPSEAWEKPEIDKTMAEMIRSNKELEQFAFAASHDLQEPLKVICVCLEFFQKKYLGKLDDNADQMIVSVLDRTKRMQQLTQNMLSYARVGKGNVEFRRIDSKALISQALENLKTTIDENDAQIIYENCPVIMGDGIQLMRVFQNLINNAIKFRKKSESPCIYISAKQNGGQWLFAVQDNGIGVELEHLESIFDVFLRLHAQSEYGGSGMGLALCKRIVESHQGKIWAESEVAKGTTVYFTVPIR